MTNEEERKAREEDLLARLSVMDGQICEVSRRLTELQMQKEKIARQLLAPRD